MTKKEAIEFLRIQIVGVNEAIERHDTLTPEQKQHWISTKEQLIERRNNFQNIIDLLREEE